MERFLDKLANSGYGKDTRSEVLRLVTTKFYRELLDSKTGGRKLYRTSLEMERARKFKRLEVKNWFKPCIYQECNE